MRQDQESYDVVIIVANWPASRIYAWDQLLIARAIENQSYVIACNIVGVDGNKLTYQGHSQVINPMGEVEQKLVQDEGVIHTIIEKSTIDRIRTSIPFLQDGDQYKIY
jgi:predicted amidohydrolase